MTITLTKAEAAMLFELRQDDEQLEETFHRVMKPMLDKHAETRLQALADAYRKLDSDSQLEAIEILRKWQEDNVPTVRER